MHEREIFEHAIDLAPADRREYVVRACADDDDLRQRVERLLAAHDQQESILDRPAEETCAAHFVRDEEERPYPFLSPANDGNLLGRLGHYDVLRCIGQGEFGVVFQAFDDKLHREVAIKVLKPELAASSIARDRFLREARSAALINHEHVVQVYSVEDSPTPYLVMEYVVGETLELRLRREGALPWKTAAALGAQIARGLAAAHARGLIHRDIKPGNILLREDRADFVKITDFGLARAVDDAGLSRPGLLIGTPRYMSPEQAQGAPLASPADLFSLGSVIYEMAGGTPAFPGDSLLGVLQAVAHERPTPLTQVVAGLPDAFYGLVASLHARDPQRRCESAQVAAALERLLEAPPAPGSSRFATVIAVSAAGLLATLLAIGVQAGWFAGGQAVGGPATTRPATARTTTVEPPTAAAASNPAAPPATPAAGSELEDADRRGANFVLSVGGAAVIADASGERPLALGEELPRGEWRLIEVNLAGREGITNLGLKSFAGCKQLRRLTIQSSHVDDAGLDYFRDCHPLEKLDLSRTRVGDEGLVVFQDCRQLRELRLAGTRVTDDGLVYFSGCRQLETLDLGDTKVSTKAVRTQFADAPLKTLIVPRDLPLFARQELKRAFPDCEISFSSSRSSRKD
ncbi:MAG: protein kinase [Pirellulales bacterium]